jgi:YHS domain-containing protein
MMSEVMTIYSNNGAVKIVTDGEYYYIQNGGCYERFDSLESAKEIAMSLY